MELKEGLASHKYRKRRFNELTADEVVDIAHAFIVEERPRRDIAEQFRVSVGLVSRINRQYRASESFIADLREKEGSRAAHVDAVAQSVANLIKRHGRISSISQVKSGHGFDDLKGLSKKRIGRIMTQDLGLRFKKARVVNERANLLSSRVQRQQFALSLI